MVVGLIPVSSSPGNRRGVSGAPADALIAAFLAIVPLLPFGPAYVGLPPFAYVDISAAALVLLWAYERIRARNVVAWPAPLSNPAWHLTLAAVAGATIFALMAEHRLDSPVFLAILRNAGDIFRPLNHATHPLYALRVALTFLEGWLVFVLIMDLCRRAPDPRRRAAAALTGWLTGFAIVSAFAVVQYLTEFRLHPYWVKANPNIVRAHSTLDDPNALGAYLVMGTGLLTGLLYFDPRRRGLRLALLVLGIAGLLTTMSRAALGASALAPLSVLAFMPRPATRTQRLVRLTGRVALASVVTVVLGSALTRTFVAERTRTQPTNEVELMVKTVDPRESTDWVLRGRLAWWDASLNMFRQDPLTGVGLGRVPRLMAAYGGGRFRENTHNLFLQMFAETGLPGGVAFLVLSFTLCAAFARRVREGVQPHARAMALGGLIGTAGFLLTLLTGHSLLLSSGQILFAAFVATVAACAAWNPDPEAAAAVPGSKRAFRTGPARVAVAALAVVAWYPIVAVARGISPTMGRWGYIAGFYSEEHAGGDVWYRWTGERALIDFDVPAGTTVMEIPLAAPTPIRDGAPVHVHLAASDVTREIVLSTPDVRTIDMPMPSAIVTGGGRVVIEIRVDPTFVPSRMDPRSSDTRILGVQVLRPRLVSRERVQSNQ